MKGSFYFPKKIIILLILFVAILASTQITLTVKEEIHKLSNSDREYQQAKMEKLKLHAVSDNKLKFIVEAMSAYNFSKNTIKLNDIAVELLSADGDKLQVTTATGDYRIAGKLVVLPGKVKILFKDYILDTKNVTLDLKPGSLHSNEPTTIKSDNLSLTSRGFYSEKTGKIVKFIGPVAISYKNLDKTLK